MSVVTNIQWCDSTINDWEGCTKVSPGCLHCHAEVRDRRMMIERVIHWGPGAPRRKSKSATAMRAALNRKQLVRRRRIFSLSQGDWLDPEVPIEWLAEMLDSIRMADQCDHLLLTKRPELWADRLHKAMRVIHNETDVWISKWLDGEPPENIWIGASAEDQKCVDDRASHLMDIPAPVHFWSLEPLLEDLGLGFVDVKQPGDRYPDWVIVGGESGPKARPCHIDWIRSIVRQCQSANVPCFVKQLGTFATMRHNGGFDVPIPHITHPKGGDPAEWPADLRVQEFPKVAR